MEQHPVRMLQRHQVMVLAFSGALLALAARGRELVQVSHRELVQGPAGLDEQPGGGLGSGGQPVPLAETQLPGGVEETVQVRAERGSVQFPPQARELAFEQVAVAGPHVPVQQQERDQRTRRRARRQLHLQRLGRPHRRVRPAGEEPAGRLPVGGVPPAGALQVPAVGRQQRPGVSPGNVYGHEPHRIPPSRARGPDGCTGPSYRRERDLAGPA